MVKFLIFVLILGACAFGFSHLAEIKGAFSLTLYNSVYEISLPIALFGLLLILALVFACVTFIKAIARSPHAALAMSRERKRRKGYEALTQGLLSISAGDPISAAKNAREAQKHAPNEPLTLLLTAQASQMGQDRQGADIAFRAMLEAPQTRLIGLRGLFMEAERKEENEHARQICEDAIKLNPSTPWAAEALLKLEVKAQDYEAGLRTIERNLTARVIDKLKARRLRAVLLTAKGTFEAAQEAVSYAPNLIPAVMATMQGLEPRKAAKLAENTWKKTPHPELANAYNALFVNESASDRFKKAENLASYNSEHYESALVIAKAACDANNFKRADEVLEPHLSIATTRLCLLKAEIATKATQDYGKAREWTQKALLAAPDMAWMSDGISLEKWLPASPLTGEVDSVIWARPAVSNIQHLIEMPVQNKPILEAAPLALSTPQQPKELWQETVFALDKLPDDPGLKINNTKKRGFFGF